MDYRRFEVLADTAFSVKTAAKEYPDNIALIIGEKSFSYAQLASAVNAWEDTIERPPTGKPYILETHSTLETLVSIYGALELNIPLLMLHPKLTTTEKTSLIDLVNSIEESLPKDIALVMFTSGTTGVPKPAMISRRALAASALSATKNLQLCPSDRWLLTLSTARIGGFSILTRSLMNRSTVVVCDHFSTETFTSVVNNELIDFVSVVPTMLSKVLDENPFWKPHPGFRSILLGGASATEKLLSTARLRGIPVITTYGMTEAASNVVTTPYEDRLTIGAQPKPNPFVEIRTEAGTFRIKGPMLMSGYWGRSTLNPGEWFDTGDIGYIGNDRDIHVEARRSDLIISGGENVYPAEVENALESIQGIAHAMVLGLPDETWGAIVTALLVPSHAPLPVDTLKKEILQRLSTYKCPRRIAWVNTLPVKSSGKPDRSPACLTRLKLTTLHYKH